MKFLQKLGKALMLPVAVLPICGILMGIGYYLCPATMQGGDIEGVRNLIGLFLVKAGGALIDNMAILFVIGVWCRYVGKERRYRRYCSFSFMADDDNTPVYRLCYKNHAIYR